jgi:hypothetical protein
VAAGPTPAAGAPHPRGPRQEALALRAAHGRVWVARVWGRAHSLSGCVILVGSRADAAPTWPCARSQSAARRLAATRGMLRMVEPPSKAVVRMASSGAAEADLGEQERSSSTRRASPRLSPRCRPPSARARQPRRAVRGP